MSTPDIEVEMYLEDESHTVDYQLTSDFYSFWRESGVPDFPVYVSYLIFHCRNNSSARDRALRGLSCLVEADFIGGGSVYVQARNIRTKANTP
jgi:hypothetical protein